jgi:hypothetical protein
MYQIIGGLTNRREIKKFLIWPPVVLHGSYKAILPQNKEKNAKMSREAMRILVQGCRFYIHINPFSTQVP